MAFLTPLTFLLLFLRSFICFRDLLTDSAKPFCSPACVSQAHVHHRDRSHAGGSARTLMSLYFGSNFFEAVRLS